MEKEVQLACQPRKECQSREQEQPPALYVLATLKYKLKALLPDAVHLILFLHLSFLSEATKITVTASSKLDSGMNIFSADEGLYYQSSLIDNIRKFYGYLLFLKMD